MILPGQDPDDELVSRILAGETNAYNQLVDKYQNYIYNLMVKMGCLPEDAKGVTQGVFIQAYCNLGSFKRESKFITWLHTIAVNRCRNWLKRSNLRRKTFEDIIVGKKISSPEEKYLEKERALQVKQALNSLTAKYRQALELFYYQGLSYVDIAGVLNISPRTVETRLYRARYMLKNAINFTNQPLDRRKVSV